MATAIYHQTCRDFLGIYAGDSFKSGTPLRAADFVFANGNSPLAGTAATLYCGKCREDVPISTKTLHTVVIPA